MELPGGTGLGGELASHAVRQAGLADRDQIAAMCALLWPESSETEHGEEVGKVLTSGFYGLMPAVFLVSHDGDGVLSGFLQLGLRSHADGCDPSRPVGFVEGWFVHERFRGRGIGGALMRAAERWAELEGCAEMASDTWIDEEQSQRAHCALGFEVVDRCVHFRKRIAAGG
jgi:aminoglycoside 6'-N-acetyltransferase I